MGAPKEDTPEEVEESDDLHPWIKYDLEGTACNERWWLPWTHWLGTATGYLKIGETDKTDGLHHPPMSTKCTCVTPL